MLVISEWCKIVTGIDWPSRRSTAWRGVVRVPHTGANAHQVTIIMSTSAIISAARVMIATIVFSLVSFKDPLKHTL